MPTSKKNQNKKYEQSLRRKYKKQRERQKQLVAQDKKLNVRVSVRVILML